MDEIREAFPQLSDTEAAAIAFEFNRWWNEDSASLSSEDHRGAIIGFAAAWIRRPGSDFSH